MVSPLPSILLVEDDDVDVEAIRRVFEKRRIANPLLVAPDGIAAMKMLHGEGDTAPIQPPFVILLDLNLPRMNGIEFLNALREDARLKDSIVIVLTTSNSDRDQIAAHAKSVAGYLLKSDLDEEFSRLVRELRPVLRFLDN